MLKSLFTPTERPRTVRQGKAHLRARVNGNLALRFNGQGLTSFAGLELVRQFLQRFEFSQRLRRHLQSGDPAGDFSSVAVVRLLLAMLMVGARRLWHVRHLVSDPVIQRFCGLGILPGDRTLSRWLSRCMGQVRAALQALNGELIAEVGQRLKLKRITLDVDGTVVSTGLTVERAFRGYNPHHRKVKSYYPITAYLAQTGHVMRVRNRSGLVADPRRVCDQSPVLSVAGLEAPDPTAATLDSPRRRPRGVRGDGHDPDREEPIAAERDLPPPRAA